MLRTYKLAEADRIVVILSKDLGQIRAVAKGVRRTTSKFGSSLEPFMHTRAQIVRGRNLDIISQTQTIHPYGAMVASDYDAYGAACAMGEAAERLTRAEDVGVSSMHFRLFHGALAALARGKHAPGMVLASYLLRALSTAGWAPTFSDCAKCGLEGPHDSISVPLGGTVCWDCRPTGARTPARPTIQLLAALMVGEWSLIDSTEEKYQREAHHVVEEYLQFHVEKNLHSLLVMEQGQNLPVLTPTAVELS